ncbi:hypothetical protein BpHYR1_015658 [Brachionus plicatilis]|uniref:Uncharacterized protein n=1 Tax=Brachionus plicatilis TaxID=10195 RepID=A0A3M7RII0_BRAPC|nr:hypothetical protein BpHYR1_015658 [Brachionus plicatilis]
MDELDTVFVTFLSVNSFGIAFLDKFLLSTLRLFFMSILVEFLEEDERQQIAFAMSYEIIGTFGQRLIRTTANYLPINLKLIIN